jgi:pimeloyl-ACP methyl ester carboxylesterase
VVLPDRGTTFVRECGPDGAPAIVLVHGLAATADLTWSAVYAPLASRYRVIALDQRGHGRGIRPALPFRLEDCADDIAAVAGVLDISQLVVVGHSMGGLVAQLLWRRHRRLVAGVVLCSTGRNFRGSVAEQATSLALPAIDATSQANPWLRTVGADVIGAGLFGSVPDPAVRRWARSEMALTSLPTLTSAARAVVGFTSHRWIGRLDVPAAVVVSDADRVVAPSRQRRLAASIPHALVYELHADHGACITRPDRFAFAIVAACEAVAGVRPEASRSVGGTVDAQPASA